MFVVLHTDELNTKIFLSQEELTALLTCGTALGRHFFHRVVGSKAREGYTFYLHQRYFHRKTLASISFLI